MDGVSDDQVNALLAWRGKKGETRIEHTHTREVVREEKLPPDALERLAALETKCAELARAIEFIAKHAVAKVDLSVEHIQ